MKRRLPAYLQVKALEGQVQAALMAAEEFTRKRSRWRQSARTACSARPCCCTLPHAPQKESLGARGVLPM